ncbi:iron ABC transporter permease [Azorhizobium oxalatiphilum]|uniref:Iron ABC transporter permease n=1 Tax=Azorhizobium oxalatiphilum TaxID=980631 RepID=A0A917F6A4_9HYPH|nr:iron ABC transporter permease [Azorhizobium oxalatiphilum]GGF50754.1 iron ABC transporter permease [Azorhizobium oxalatiphilum]
MKSMDCAETDAALVAYDRLVRRRVLVLAALGLACLAGFLVDITSGPSSLGVVRSLSGILMPDILSRAEHVMIWNLRLPVAAMAVLVGMALSLAGAELQTVLNNPLASPMTLGLSSAASFGAALAIVLGIGIPGVPSALIVTANAFLFAFGSVQMLQALARRSAGDRDTLILFGIGLLFTFNAGVALVQFLASADALQQFVFWGMGSLSRANWMSVAILGAVVVLMFPFSLRTAWQMTALRFGDDRALSFGVDVRRLRFFALLRISLLAATAVAFCGTIGFIGIVGPHIARMLIGEDHRFFLPASLLTGALVMTFASIASKSLMPGVVIPIGIVTSFVGLPVFFLLVMRRGTPR